MSERQYNAACLLMSNEKGAMEAEDYSSGPLRYAQHIRLSQHGWFMAVDYGVSATIPLVANFAGLQSARPEHLMGCMAAQRNDR